MTSIGRHNELGQHVDLTEHGDLSQHGDFDSEQAAMLQALARNGAPEAQLYGFHDNGQHLNGYGDEGSNDPHSTGLLSSQQDLDLTDPAALLESLASYEHPPSSSNLPISNDHFASLLQAAAATAGGQDVALHDSEQSRRTIAQSRSVEEFGEVAGYISECAGQRNHNESGVSETRGVVKRRYKRRKVVDEVEEAEQLARERAIWGPEELEEDDNSDDEPHYEHPPISTSEARAVGVASAVALFRRPTSASRKYTRPPMSKLFTSLELTPEQFIHLQAAAKNYMLDDSYPERRECVGSRGRGDTDMVKLKLFECVKSFLEDEGWGERCWGPASDDAANRKLKWPQMKNKIISLVTPLLRRMVTNERQRRYARVTRASHKESSPSAKGGQISAQDPQSANPPREAPTPSVDRDVSAQYPEIDPKLDQYHYSFDHAFASKSPSPASRRQDSTINTSEQDTYRASSLIPETSIAYHLNILHSGVRIRPKVTLSPTNCPSLSSLIQHVRSALSDDSISISRIDVLDVNGLREIENEDGWAEATEAVAETEWMDGEVKVVVEVAYKG